MGYQRESKLFYTFFVVPVNAWSGTKTDKYEEPVETGNSVQVGNFAWQNQTHMQSYQISPDFSLDWLKIINPYQIIYPSLGLIRLDLVISSCTPQCHEFRYHTYPPSHVVWSLLFFASRISKLSGVQNIRVLTFSFPSQH